MRNFEVLATKYDAARPYAVVATFRSFDKVIARYPDRRSAMRYAAQRNRRMKEERK